LSPRSIWLYTIFVLINGSFKRVKELVCCYFRLFEVFDHVSCTDECWDQWAHLKLFICSTWQTISWILKPTPVLIFDWMQNQHIFYLLNITEFLKQMDQNILRKFDLNKNSNKLENLLFENMLCLQSLLLIWTNRLTSVRMSCKAYPLRVFKWISP